MTQVTLELPSSYIVAVLLVSYSCWYLCKLQAFKLDRFGVTRWKRVVHLTTEMCSRPRPFSLDQGDDYHAFPLSLLDFLFTISSSRFSMVESQSLISSFEFDSCISYVTRRA